MRSLVRLPGTPRHPVSLAGVAVVTATAALFLVLIVLESLGVLTNPYLGLLVFVAVPMLFIAGLLLIPVGAWMAARRRRRDLVSSDWPVVDLREPRHRATALAVLVLTAINLAIVSMAAYGGVHYMESAAFCGQVCHTTMEPQAVAHRAFPHAAVACTQCHVGPGAGAFVRGKLAGTRQLLEVMTNRVPVPIRPPADLLQPVTVSCEQCHARDVRRDDRLRVVREYASDEASSESITSIRLHVGDSRTGIHRHVALEIDYVALDETKTAIPLVRVRDDRGRVREYVGEGDARAPGSVTRRMTCLDCHNRPAHTFFSTAERAIDDALARGALPRELPFIRRESVAALKSTNGRREAALDDIARRLRMFYRSRVGNSPELVARAVAGTQQVWMSNVFPAMNVTWGTYPNHLGHVDSAGCFRCHDDSHKAADGRVISQSCVLCHTLPE